jgi:Tfp pilus assembly protein PilN
VTHNDDGQRIAVLETKIEHLSQQLAETNAMMTEMRDVLLQAKGAKWVIVGAAGIIGVLTSIVTHLIPFKAMFK